MTTLLTVGSFGRNGQFEDDGVVTKTSIEQKRVESSVAQCFYQYNEEVDEETFKNQELFVLSRRKHIAFLERALFGGMSSSLEALDSSRAWLVYWISHSLALLDNHDFLKENASKIADFLKRCESPEEGGYAGGPGQCSHLAATYAAVNALITVGETIALESIDREGVRKFILSMQQPNGAFSLHAGGEIDIRGVYCALSVAKLLDIPVHGDERCTDGLFANTVEWLIQCQTYEGGFGAAPGHEAHGGYSFCGVASLVMLDQLHRCDMDALLYWTVNKQLKLEGGFAGRTNKLVDGCYSFWVAAIAAILQVAVIDEKHTKNIDTWLFNEEALQEYILACCQNTGGGLKDKPGKNPDYYHTCYTLAGLSLAQHSEDPDAILGPRATNELEVINPVCNLTLAAVAKAKAFFFK